jgi:hypothetical protein
MIACLIGSTSLAKSLNMLFLKVIHSSHITLLLLNRLVLSMCGQNVYPTNYTILCISWFSHVYALNLNSMYSLFNSIDPFLSSNRDVAKRIPVSQ